MRLWTRYNKHKPGPKKIIIIKKYVPVGWAINVPPAIPTDMLFSANTAKQVMGVLKQTLKIVPILGKL